MVSSRTPCTPLRVCTPSPCFPICGIAVTDVKCNCAGSPHFDTHPMYSPRTPCTLLQVCAPSRLLPNRCHRYCWWQVQLCWFTTHIPDGHPNDAVHSPERLHTTPSLEIWASTSQFRPPSSSATVQVHQTPTDTHPMVSPRMPCTPLRVCAPPRVSQCGPALLASRATKDIFNKLKILWRAISSETCSEHSSPLEIFKQARDVFNMVNSK